MNNSSDSDHLKTLLSRWNKMTLTAVNKVDWTKTRFYQFAVMVFCYIYEYIGNKLKIPDNYKAAFWQNLAQAHQRLNDTSTFYTKSIISQKLLSELITKVKQGTLPLALIERVTSLSGNPITQPEEWKQSTKKVQIQIENSKGPRKSYPPQKCKYCKAGKCWKEEHKK